MFPNCEATSLPVAAAAAGSIVAAEVAVAARVVVGRSQPDLPGSTAGGLGSRLGLGPRPGFGCRASLRSTAGGLCPRGRWPGVGVRRGGDESRRGHRRDISSTHGKNSRILEFI